MNKMLVPMILPPLLLLELIVSVMSVLNSVQVISYRGARKTKKGPVMCALDTANETTSLSSLQDCSLKCGRDAICNGINIKNLLTCEVFNYKPKITSRVSDCMFYQKIAIGAESNDTDCLQFGNDVTSIPSQCCAYPYTLNGGLYYNCTIRSPLIDFGCYSNNGQWVTCQQPEDYVAKYEEASTTVLSANPAVAVPLLTIDGWILMQRKVMGGSVSFNQNWAEYRDGFGLAAGNDNYWLGLDKVYRLVQQGSVTLRVEIQRTSGLWYSAEYSTFSISDEVGKYRLTVAGYNGDADDALLVSGHPRKVANGMMFSTRDSDNDISPGHCAAEYNRGWWDGWCSNSALNRRVFVVWSSIPLPPDVQTSHMLVKLN